MELTLVLITLPLLFITLFGLKYFFKSTEGLFRYKSIEGLRGYLSFFVFLHHSAVWFGYIKIGRWELPASKIYTAGQCVISFFFMITGFLFFSKLLEKRNTVINWTWFYKARFYRLAPIYFFAITLLMLVVYFESRFRLLDFPGRNAEDMLKWYLFTLVGTPDINRHKDTYLVVAGVQWSLVYEWIFYLFLPLAAYFFYKIKTPKILLIICSLLLLLIIIKNELRFIYLPAFLSGLLASFLVKMEKFTKFSRHVMGSFTVLFCLLFIFIFFNKFNAIPFVFATILFCLIAGGNSFFGILNTKISVILGRLSYSIYLLHGIVLYIVMNYIIGIETAKSLSETEYCLVIAACIPPLLAISAATYHFIEARFVAYGNKRRE